MAAEQKPSTATLNEIVSSLSAEAAHRVIAGLTAMPEEKRQAFAAVADSLRGVAMRRRGQHARRIFTRILEPVLSPRERQLTRDGIVGVFHRVDVAGIWGWLAGRIGAETIERLQAAFQPLVTETGAAAFQSDMAREMRAFLRTQAIQALEAALRGPDTPKVLAEINERRARDRRGRDELRSLGRADLQLVRDILVHEDLVLPFVPLIRASLAEGRLPKQFATASLKLFLGHAEKGTTGDILPVLLPLVALGIEDDPRLACSVLGDPKLPANQRSHLMTGLARHLAGRCETTAATILRRATHGDEGHMGEAMRRFATTLEACTTAGLFRDTVQATAARATVNHHVLDVRERVEPILLRIMIEALRRPLGDSDPFGTYRRTLADLDAWRTILATLPFAVPEVEPSDQALLAQMKNGLVAVISGEGAGDGLRYRRLLDIDACARRIGGSAAAWIGPLDRWAFVITLERLEQDAPLAPEERLLARDIAEIARLELNRSRRWKDQLLVDYVALADRRLNSPDRPS